MAKQRGYKRPTRRLRRSKDGKKSFAQRLRERKQAVHEPVQITGFKSFLKTVWGKEPTVKEFNQARTQANRFSKEFDNPKISLKRLREIYDQRAKPYLKLIIPLRVEAEVQIISKWGNLQPNSKIASLCSGPDTLLGQNARGRLTHPANQSRRKGAGIDQALPENLTVH
ncbi:MAG: hypothetical protein QGI60_00100 [archaeon]|jgi:hypothetical protein|nr:hypothetical protein [archaeon]